MFTVLSSCLLYPLTGNQAQIIYRDKVHKKLKCFESNVTVTKRAKFVIGIVDNLCPLQQHKCMEHNQCTIVPRLIINEPYGSNFMTILQSLKKLAVIERLFSQLGTCLIVAVVERSK